MEIREVLKDLAERLDDARITAIEIDTENMSSHDVKRLKKVTAILITNVAVLTEIIEDKYPFAKL